MSALLQVQGGLNRCKKIAKNIYSKCLPSFDFAVIRSNTDWNAPHLAVASSRLQTRRLQYTSVARQEGFYVWLASRWFKQM